MKNVGLFERVERSDREGLFSKGYVAAKWLRILSIIGLVLVVITLVPVIFGAGLLGGTAGLLGGFAVGAVTGVMLIFYMILYIVIVGGAAFLMFYYSGSLMNAFENGVIPNILLAYIFIIFQIFSILGAIFSENSGILQIVYAIFVGYLWYMVIDSVRKLSR